MNVAITANLLIFWGSSFFVFNNFSHFQALVRVSLSYLSPARRSFSDVFVFVFASSLGTFLPPPPPFLALGVLNLRKFFSGREFTRTIFSRNLYSEEKAAHMVLTFQL